MRPAFLEILKYFYLPGLFVYYFYLKYLCGITRTTRNITQVVWVGSFIGLGMDNLRTHTIVFWISILVLALITWIIFNSLRTRTQ